MFICVKLYYIYVQSVLMVDPLMYELDDDPRGLLLKCITVLCQ